MKRVIQFSALLAGSLFAASVFAQAPAGAPAGASGICKDGSYSTAASKQGACRGHKGVQDWYSAAPAAKTTPAAPAAAAKTMAPAAGATTATVAAPVAAAAPAPAPAPAMAPAMTKATTNKPAAFTPPAVAAPGGGAGKVWVNKSSKVYHCSDDRWYGKTKDGAYMSEADAAAAGYKPDHGKACKA